MCINCECLSKHICLDVVEKGKLYETGYYFVKQKCFNVGEWWFCLIIMTHLACIISL